MAYLGKGLHTVTAKLAIDSDTLDSCNKWGDLHSKSGEREIGRSGDFHYFIKKKIGRSPAKLGDLEALYPRDQHVSDSHQKYLEFTPKACFVAEKEKIN